jgi:molecular chaperone Hsp33
MTRRAKDRDALATFVFEHAGVRGAVIHLEATSAAILGSHPYPPALTRTLAQMLAASALLASTLKLAGSLVVQLAGDGPVRLVVVECDDLLAMRATAQWDNARVTALGPDATLNDLAGGSTHARLTLTLDPRDGAALYQGIVSLDTTSIAASIEHYLRTSEQLGSRLWLAARSTSVSGLLLQRLPGAGEVDDATWRRVSGLGDDVVDAALTQPAFAPTLRALFPRDDVRLFDSRPVTFRCKCSVARVARALQIAGRDEVDAAIAERGLVEVTCEFCNRRYTFQPHEAHALLHATHEDRGKASGDEK